jgi:Na+/H+ antiporter NhaC
LFCTWGLGLTMFVDDYLNSLAVGSAMRSVTDRYRTSREMLAYVVDSTAAPVR